MTAKVPANSSRRSVEQALRAIGLLFRPGEVIEIRALNVDRNTNRAGVIYSGYFNFEAKDEIIAALTSLFDRAEGIYVVLNKLNPALLARARNRLQSKPKFTTSDADIIEWRWLYIDVDPVRPAGISSSDEEHEAAIERTIHIRDFLSARGWPEPVCADSGNGAHLLYSLPVLELDRAGKLVEECLKALDAQFSDSSVKVDTSTANAARLCKLYGTKARKGDPTPERPHRVARIVEEPEKLIPVPVGALEALASEIRPPTLQATTTGPYVITRRQFPSNDAFDLAQWIQSHALDVEGPEPWKGGARWIFRICPWNAEHRNRSAFIIQLPNGAIGAGCHHNGCQGKDWHALRDLVEPGWRSKPGDAQAVASVLIPEWEPPIPFDQFNLPRFPISVFPSWLSTFIEAEARATQTPPDLTAMLVLSVLAAACAKKVRIEVKEGHQEPLNIFTVTSLPPGNRKSAVFSRVIKPVEDYEGEEARRTAGEVASAKALRKIKESKLKNIQEKAAKAKGLEFDSLTEQAASLAAELAATPERVPTRCIADDCTPEKLSGLLREQRGRIALLSPEGDVFDLMAGRYSTNGNSNLGVYLKGHSGDTLRVDRVNRLPELVKEPALIVGLAVQPEVIRGLATRPGFRGRGLLGRFLYSMPASQLGYRDPSAPPLPENVYELYHGGLLVLLNLPDQKGEDGKSTPQVLTIEPGGQERLRDFGIWLEPQLSEFGELGRMTDWGGKLVGAVARITGLLHMAEHAGADNPGSLPVQDATVARAIEIGMYLIPHAKAAFAEMGADEVAENAKVILRWICNGHLDSFSRRDVHQGLRGVFKRVADVDGPLLLLIERGYIRKRPESPNTGAGRPASPAFDVNPLWPH